MTDYKFLKPYQFKNGAKLQNKVVMAPTTEKSSFYDGTVSNDEINYFRSRSGVGMLITGSTNVDRDGKGFAGGLSIDNDRFIPRLKHLANAIQSKGSKAVLQIFSAGRQSDPTLISNRTPYSASAVASPDSDARTPRELSNQEIKNLIHDFGEATLRAIKAGFDGVEIHGANFYLLHQFFSPQSNRRDDNWGGSVDKRMNLGLAVIKEVRKVIDQYGKSDFILGYRISPEESPKYQPGIRLNDSLKFIDKLADQQIDYIHSSLGNYLGTSKNDTNDKETINQHILKTINGRKPLIVVGSIKTPKDVDNALDRGADLAAMSKELIAEPRWIQKVEHNDEKSLRYQISPDEMDELDIPYGFQHYLLNDFRRMIDWTNME